MIFDNTDVDKISNIKWQQFVLPQVKRVILKMKSKQPPIPQKPKSEVVGHCELFKVCDQRDTILSLRFDR